jgi:hypothetical protein
MTQSSMISSSTPRFVRMPILTCSAMLGALLLVTATPRSIHAQRSNAASGASAQPYDSSLFAALKWREIGPYRGGRSVAVAGSDKRPYEYWMGTTGGGVFKTTDGGHSW